MKIIHASIVLSVLVATTSLFAARADRSRDFAIGCVVGRSMPEDPGSIGESIRQSGAESKQRLTIMFALPDDGENLPLEFRAFDPGSILGGSKIVELNDPSSGHLVMSFTSSESAGYPSTLRAVFDLRGKEGEQEILIVKADADTGEVLDAYKGSCLMATRGDALELYELMSAQ